MSIATSCKPLTKPTIQQQIEGYFEAEDASESPHQSNVLVSIYKLALPDWDAITSLAGYPAVNRKTNVAISGLFMAFDRKHHPDVMNGGLWMNNGFTTDESLGDWEISTATCKASYGGEVSR